MTHEKTPPVTGIMDEILADLENQADEYDSIHAGEGDLLRSAAELIRQQQALIAQQGAPVAVQDEREAFEAWWKSAEVLKGKRDVALDAWEARAMLAAAPTPPAPEQAEQDAVPVPRGLLDRCMSTAARAWGVGSEIENELRALLKGGDV